MKNYNNSKKCLLLSHELSIILSIANRTKSISTIRTAEYNPNFPISLAIASNFSYKGVTSGYAKI